MAINLTFDKTHYPAPLCGIDEVGRGPLIGPVVAACLFIPENLLPELEGINDSKKLSEKKREAFYTLLTEQASYGIGMASAEEIDQINILQASFLAMQRAYDHMIKHFDIRCKAALIDGNKAPSIFPISTYTLIQGDGKSPSIAAASILAKVTRDRLVQQMAKTYPVYGWESNKGYPSKQHLEALNKYGPSPYHRKSYKPVAKLLEKQVQAA